MGSKTVERSKNWEQVKAVLQQVLELEEGDRQEFLDNAGLNADVRSEVESLLSFEQAAENLMPLSAVEFSKQFFDDDDEARNALVGQNIGAYRIVRELGYGGMGAVFLAERADGKFQQRVALKLLKREMNTSALRRRFRQEREILASLEHPNIARLLDAGTTDDKIPFLAMEYVEGTEIDDYCNTHDLNLNQRLDLFRQVCTAVNFAHRNLVVHRDLKPSNILVTNDGIPKLLDFGISKILSTEISEPANSATVTRLGVMTPSYASPEQIQNKSVTTSTDIYSLGIILYELLSGHRPFEAKEANLKEIYQAVIESNPPPPSALIGMTTRTVKESAKEIPKNPSESETEIQAENADTNAQKMLHTNPHKTHLSASSVRGDLDNIVLKALRKEPERRYLSADNFAEDIKRYQTGLPVTARPNTFIYRAEKFVKRNALAVGAASMILLAIIGGAAATWYQSQRAEAQRIRAEKRFNDVRSLANAFLFDISPKIENLPGSTPARVALVERALEYLDSLSQEAQGDAALQRELAAAYEKVGDVQGNPYQPNIGDLAGALSSYEKAGRIREDLFNRNQQDAGLKKELAVNLRLAGDIKFWSGGTEKADENYQRSIELLNDLSKSNPDNPELQLNLATAMLATGSVKFWQGDNKAALVQYLPAAELLAKLHQAQPDNPKITGKYGNAYTRIGDAYGWDDDPVRGAENLKKAVEILDPLMAQYPNDGELRGYTYLAHLKSGESRTTAKDWEQVFLHFRKCLETMQENVRVDPQNVRAKRDLSISLNKIGDTYDNTGKSAEGMKYYQQALALQQAIANADPKNSDIRSDIGNTLKRISYAAIKLKDYELALDSSRKSLEIHEKRLAEDPNNPKSKREMGVVSQSIGAVYQMMGEQKREFSYWQQSLDWFQKSRKIITELKDAGKLDEYDNSLFDELDEQVKKSETEIAKLKK